MVAQYSNPIEPGKGYAAVASREPTRSALILIATTAGGE
jgi:hypothetical protein